MSEAENGAEEVVVSAPEDALPLEAPAVLPTSPEPQPPVNKLHEWLAALVIMLLLGGMLFVFLSFLRNASL